MHEEQANLEQKNNELVTAYRDKSKAQQQLQKLYQSLKAQVMASHVANAAGDEADITLQTARGDRYVDKLPGARSGNPNYGQPGGAPRHGGRQQYHNRDGSGGSGSSGGPQRGGGIGLGGLGHAQGQGYGLGGRNFTGRKSSTLCCWT